VKTKKRKNRNEQLSLEKLEGRKKGGSELREKRHAQSQESVERGKDIH